MIATPLTRPAYRKGATFATFFIRIVDPMKSLIRLHSPKWPFASRFAADPSRELRILTLVVLLAMLGVCFVGSLQRTSESSEATQSQPLLLVDDEEKPWGTISWPTIQGHTRTLDFTLPYRSPNERADIGTNVSAFVCVGGTRQDKGASHPRGTTIRIGFYKEDLSKPFFADIKDRASVTVTLRGVRFNQPGYPRPRTILQHLKYNPEDLVACGLSDTALDQYNTSHRDETLHGVITTTNGRLGVLDGVTPGGGTARLTVEDDGSITLVATMPYALFRHVGDPWLRTSPRTFFEPNHFHLEYEVVPRQVARGLASMGEELPGFVNRDETR